MIEHPYDVPEEFKERISSNTGLTRFTLFAPDFQELTYKEQAERLVNDLSIYFHYLTSDKVRDYCTTIYLRAYCGCEEEKYFDELSQTWIVIDGHDNGCLRKRYSIMEDLTNKTLLRRRQKEKPLCPADMQTAEERMYA